MTRDQLAELIEQHNMKAEREGLLGLAENCIGLASKRDKSKPCKIGTSKLGGDPDLPDGIEWPISEGHDLYFMAQIRLSELPPVAAELGLPISGMLYFFYDMEKQPWGFDPKDKAGHRVVFVDSESGLARVATPEAIAYDDGVLECALTPFTTLSLPSCLPSQLFVHSDEISDESEPYCDLLDALASDHQLLGLPREVQNPMELECQLASNGLYCGDSTGYEDPQAAALEAGAEDWRLLFQFQSDDNAGVMWGDVGTIYYWIRKQDLAARRFDKTWLVLQCY